MAEGLHIAREEDGYALRHVGSYIDDGFPLHIDDSGTAFAFALILGSAPQHAGKLAYFRSDDGCRRWTGPTPVSGKAVNPSVLDRRSGSPLGGKDLGFVDCASAEPPFHSYVWSSIPLGLTDTNTRWDRWGAGLDGILDYTRSYAEPNTGRSYYFVYDNAANGQYTLTYSYKIGAYYQVYIARSNGSYRYYNSDGYSTQYEAPDDYGYWSTGADGARDYVHIFKDPANATNWWYFYDYHRSGAWTYTYGYYRGSYWYVEIRRSSGSFQKSDSTGYNQSG